MKKYTGYFLYYVNGVLKQHTFKNAAEIQVLEWEMVHMMRGKQYMGKNLTEVNNGEALHLGW